MNDDLLRNFIDEFGPFLSWLRENKNLFIQGTQSPTPTPVSVDLSPVLERAERAEQVCKEALDTIKAIRTELAASHTGVVPYDDRLVRERLDALELAVANLKPQVVYVPVPVEPPTVEEVPDGNAG